MLMDTNISFNTTTLYNNQSNPLSLYLLILILIAVSSICGNLINLIITYRSPALWSISNCLLTALALTDFLTGLIAMPCAIMALYRSGDIALCQAQGFLVTFFNGASLVMVAAVSIDRCSAVCNPYHYLSDLRVSRYAISIASVWLIPLPLAAMPLLPLEKYGLGSYTYQNICWISLSVDSSNYAAIGIFAACMSSAIAVVICCYSIIFFIAYNKSNTPIIGFTGIRKSIRTTSLIVGSSLVCWLPITAICIYSLTHYLTFGRKVIVSRGIEVIVMMLTYCNAAINPIIYATTNSIIRKHLKSSIFLFRGILVACPRCQRISFYPNFLKTRTSRITPMELVMTV